MFIFTRNDKEYLIITHKNIQSNSKQFNESNEICNLIILSRNEYQKVILFVLPLRGLQFNMYNDYPPFELPQQYYELHVIQCQLLCEHLVFLLNVFVHVLYEQSDCLNMFQDSVSSACLPHDVLVID